MTPLFELGDRTQRSRIELGDGDADHPCVLRLRRGTPITASVVRELNDLLADEDDTRPSTDPATEGAH